jgi:hypothetical protein
MAFSTITTFVGRMKITNAFLNAIQAAMEGFIDGVGGGTYTNSSAINIAGQLNMSGNGGQFGWRIDTTTANDSAAQLNVQKDFYICETAITTPRTWTLRTNGAVTGNVIWVSREDAGGNAVTIVSNAGGSTLSVTLNQRSIGPCHAGFVFDGTEWRLFMYGAMNTYAAWTP